MFNPVTSYYYLPYIFQMINTAHVPISFKFKNLNKNIPATSCLLADPPSGWVSSIFTHVHPCVRACVRVQLTKLFDIFGSG